MNHVEDPMKKFITQIATIEIPISNLESSIEFYVDILGVKVIYQGEQDAMLSFQSIGVPTIYLVETEETYTLSFENTNNGIIHSIIDFYTPSLKEFYDFLKMKNVEVGPLNINENGLGGFGFKDIDGNRLSACNIKHDIH